MAEQPEDGAAQPFDAERTWQQLTRLFAWGDRLDFVFLDYLSPDVFAAWRRALRAYCAERGQPWSQPARKQTFIDWLEGERKRGETKEREEGEARAREVYLGTIPQGRDAQGRDERWVFARINENRDNLVKALNGVLCLAGENDFTRRLAYAAPSVWAMRSKSFTLAGPPPARVRVPPPPPPGSQPDTLQEPPSYDFDVLVSAAARDEGEARDLLKRLAAEGITGTLATDEKGHEALEQARLVVVLLSGTYAYSSAWDALRGSRLAREQPDELRWRIVPVMLSEGPLPYLVRDMAPLDFRTPEVKARNQARLVSVLRGEREESTGPGLAPAMPTPPRDSGWLDCTKFSLSDANERELLNLMVRAYPEHDSIQRIMDHIGIRQEVIAWETTSLRYIWHAVLVLAARKKRVRGLVQYVLSDPASAPYHAAIRKVIGEAPAGG
jgi:hypothetical protein